MDVNLPNGCRAIWCTEYWPYVCYIYRKSDNCKTTDKVKSTYRDAKDKVCEMIDGKMKCVAKKIKNKALNMADKLETDATELKNKVDK